MGKFSEEYPNMRKGLLSLTLGGVIASAAIVFTDAYLDARKNAINARLNPQYINSRNIEFIAKDLNSDGKDETIMTINKDNIKKEYLLKYVNGEPKLIPYHVEHKIIEDGEK